jgi:hypothetical protein
MTKAEMDTRRTGGDDRADLDITVRDNHSVNEEFDQLAALREGRLGKALLDVLAESLNGRHDLCESLVLIHLCLQLLPLPLQCLQTLVHCLPPAPIFRQRHRSGLIGIAHALYLASQMLHPALQLGAPRLEFLG